MRIRHRHHAMPCPGQPGIVECLTCGAIGTVKPGTIAARIVTWSKRKRKAAR